ncbi:MAG TPA: ABC transporter permease [Methylococcaceae bacterium]|nr:ABC transporter permease [Methylococcaceae bacterium]
MSDLPFDDLLPPAIEAVSTQEDTAVRLTGSWNLRGLGRAGDDLAPRLAHHAKDASAAWDLSTLDALDSAGALLLWQAWGERVPDRIRMRSEHADIFARWRNHPAADAAIARRSEPWSARLHALARGFMTHLLELVTLLGQLILDVGFLLRHPRAIPWREISATIHETGGRALGITALVGFLIGVVVSYLSSLQLQTFGAQIYIVNILGMSIIRELGPMLAAILVAGRSGSAMTARLGAMRVTQELDALSAIGISHSLRLVLPKVAALGLALPLLVVWTDIIALVGGAMSARIELDLSPYQFVLKLPGAVPVANYYIGLAKGVVFGLFIALVACHFGLRIEPNTESLGNETTNSVVVAITLVILVDALFAIAFRSVGLP